MRIIVMYCVAVPLWASVCASSDIPRVLTFRRRPSWPRSVEIAGWHAEAVAVALQEFRKHQGGKTDKGEPVYGDLRHYSVQLSRSPKAELPLRYAHEECVRVDFVPEYSERDRREATLGGRTHYGIEVSYDILKRNLKIIKTSFSR
ncbi:MAG TPA: hypothetical protein VFX07_02680 [Candidatus Udaeobacter sp.]|jgi:hypothetical protein|nr:hypothetical protein [Candidatus Udaeobacter sp.]